MPAKRNSYVKVGDFSVRTDAENAPADLEALGKSRMASFGQDLSDVELGWIREVVLKAVAA